MVKNEMKIKITVKCVENWMHVDKYIASQELDFDVVRHIIHVYYVDLQSTTDNYIS